MQHYRVNYPLLIGLAVGTVVCSGVVYGLWKFQIERKSDWLLGVAEDSLKKGEVRDAAQYYGQYLTIHSEDDATRYKYANALMDMTEQDDATPEDVGTAVRGLESILRNDKGENEDANKVRRRLINLYGKGNYQAALDHLTILLNAKPDDAELLALRAMFLARSGDNKNAVEVCCRLTGYNEKTDKFDPQAAKGPHEVEAYSTLATLARNFLKKPELSDRILDQMVAVNPKSAKAYVQRGILHALWGNAEATHADAEKALQLQPDDIDVLMFVTDIAEQDQQMDKARGYVDKAKKLFPNDARVYQAAATLEVKDKHYDKALASLEEGIQKNPGLKGVGLILFKASLQLQQPDVAGARKTVDDLRKIRNLRPEIIDDISARILLVEGKWVEAAEMFSKLSANAIELGRERQMDIMYNLGLCYERMGQPDQAKEQYNKVLAIDQQNEPARAGIQRMSQQLGIEIKDERTDAWAKAVEEEMAKPKEQRDRSRLTGMLQDIAKQRNLDPITIKLTEAQLALMQEDYDGAAKLITDARKDAPTNLRVLRMALALALANPKMGPQVAMNVWEKMSAQFGDLPELRLDKATILLQLNKDKQDKGPLKQELASLLAGIEKWTPAQKVELWRGMTSKYLGLGMADEARQCLALAADALPDELPLVLAEFSMALDAGDDEGMKAAQDKILKVVKDKNNSQWLFAEARRRLNLVRRGRSGPEELAEIRNLTKQALLQRPEWSELYILSGDVELLANNPALALQNYDRAETLGRPAPNDVAKHIRLLATQGRFADAGKLLERIPESVRQLLLGPLYGEVLFRTKQTDAAIKQARAATETDPTNVQNQYWYGQLLARAAQDLPAEKRNPMMADAIKAMQKATELQPEFPDAWFALINYHAMQKDEQQAQKAMRDAQLALSGDNLATFLARTYEVLHRWFDAETLYREIYETAPDDLGRVQQLAAFYVGPLYQLPDRQSKATPLINQILRAGAEKRVPPNDPNLLWARRTAAKMLAATKDYPSLVKAEKMLCSNTQDGSLLIDDKLALAEILAQRPEPESRKKAIQLLEDVAQVQPLNESAETQLGELYFAVGSNWTKFRDHMEKTIATYPNSLKAREVYTRHLLARNDARSLEDAARQTERLHQLAPNSPITFELAVRLAGKRGNQQQVRAELLSRLPKIPEGKDLDPNLAQQMALYANLLVDLGDLDSAEKIYRDLAARIPALGFDYAKFLGLRRDPDQCFAKLNEIYTPANASDVLAVALAVARERRDKIGDKHDAEIQKWLDASLRENPDSIAMMIVQADLFDLQKKYEDSANVYRKLLANKDLTGIRRAVVLNNLAFLVALAGPNAAGGSDPLPLVQEAIQIMGPNAEILDTRAVVLTAQKKYKEAVQDLELAVTDNPTSSKYYHKARAHFLDNEPSKAVEAWEKAESLGLNHEALNRMEFEQFDELKAKIDQLRKKSVTQAEPPRKAG